MEPMPSARLAGERNTKVTQERTMSAVSLMAASVCSRFSAISAFIARRLTSSLSRAALILASSSILALSTASRTPISARRSSDWSRSSRSSFSPCRLTSSCRRLEASCSFIRSRSASFFCSVSWATRAWCSWVLWSSLLRCSSPRSAMVFCSSDHRIASISCLTFSTSSSVSTAFRFSTRSARASRSTASRNSAMKAAMALSCSRVAFRSSSRPTCMDA
mmetsp:Transcript_35753/g.93358  ORF Transcript_35753/g.93358 Transcript_35753/m.93358 type:complete len:219 (+) Transcript_35753:1344-2000(+)